MLIALLTTALVVAPAVAGPRGGRAAKKPPVLSLTELELRSIPTKGKAPVHRKIRVAHPRGWTPEAESDGRSIRLFGPNGEGRILIAAALDPPGLNEYLAELKEAHPSVAPSPPMAMTVSGIRTELGERATRFVIQGPEMGEMVMIERHDTIVLIVTIVEPSAWPELAKVMARCYPTVEVVDVASGPK